MTVCAAVFRSPTEYALAVDSGATYGNLRLYGPKAIWSGRCRRAEVYRAILRPGSGACASEREQAEVHLRRMGMATEGAAVAVGRGG